MKQVRSDLEGIKNQIGILQGMIQKQDQQILLNKIEKEDARMRDLRNNLLISGLDEEEEEDETMTAELVTDFLSQTVKVEGGVDIQSAVKIGKGDPRKVLVKLNDAKDKGPIFKAVRNLKHARNSKDGSYSINNQLPPRLQEQQRWFRQLMKLNAGFTGLNQRNMEIKKGMLMVDGYPYKSPITPPSARELVFPFRLGTCK